MCKKCGGLGRIETPYEVVIPDNAPYDPEDPDSQPLDVVETRMKSEICKECEGSGLATNS